MTWCLSVLSPAYHWPLSGSPGSCLVETPGKRDGEFGCTKSCQSYQSLQQSEFDHPKILCQNPIPTGICIPVMQSALPNPYKSHIISYQIGNLPSKKKTEDYCHPNSRSGTPMDPLPPSLPIRLQSLGCRHAGSHDLSPGAIHFAEEATLRGHLLHDVLAGGTRRSLG